MSFVTSFGGAASASGAGTALKMVTVETEADRLVLTSEDVSLRDIVNQVGIAQEFNVECAANIGNQLNGTYVTVEEEDGTVAFWFSSAQTEVLEIDFTGLSGVDFDVAGSSPGKYLVVFAKNSPDVRHYFWFSVIGAIDQATDPGGGGVGHQINVLAVDNADALASAISSAISGITGLAAQASGAVVTVEQLNAGAVTASDAGTSGVVMTVTQPGQDAASEPSHGASRAILINSVCAGDTEEVVATHLASAFDGESEWQASAASYMVNVSSQSKGARMVPEDHGTGFTFSESVTGVDPGGLFDVVDVTALGTADAFRAL